MESMSACRQRVQELRCQARGQVDALGVLEEAFAQEAEHLRKHDQVQYLDALRARVVQDVEDTQRSEVTASLTFNEVALISGLAKFALGSLAAAALHTQEHPFSIGAKLARSDFVRTKPFGTVVVTVGPGGVPDEVNVISLSRYARELARSESEVMAALETQGYRLMMTETFLRFLDELKEKVLKGFVTLPVASASFLLKPADRDSE